MSQVLDKITEDLTLAITEHIRQAGEMTGYGKVRAWFIKIVCLFIRGQKTKSEGGRDFKLFSPPSPSQPVN